MVYWCGNKLSKTTFNIERLEFFVVHVCGRYFPHCFSIFNIRSGKVRMACREIRALPVVDFVYGIKYSQSVIFIRGSFMSFLFDGFFVVDL